MDAFEPGQLVVGITGHRPNRLRVGEAQLRRRFAHVLHALKRGSEARGNGQTPAGTLPRRPVALSALAEGADRSFAEVALSLGYALHVVLPLPVRDYQATFTQPAGQAAFDALGAQATRLDALPGDPADQPAAYEAMGRAIVDASAVFIGVWDGQPSAGRGGTPEIIAYALQHCKPVIWIDAGRDRPPRLLRQPTAGGPRQIALSTLAARAQPLSPSDIARLAALRHVSS